jgi:hypothetical protein
MKCIVVTIFFILAGLSKKYAAAAAAEETLSIEAISPETWQWLKAHVDSLWALRSLVKSYESFCLLEDVQQALRFVCTFDTLVVDEADKERNADGMASFRLFLDSVVLFRQMPNLEVPLASDKHALACSLLRLPIQAEAPVLTPRQLHYFLCKKSLFYLFKGNMPANQVELYPALLSCLLDDAVLQKVRLTSRLIPELPIKVAAGSLSAAEIDSAVKQPENAKIPLTGPSDSAEISSKSPLRARKAIYPPPQQTNSRRLIQMRSISPEIPSSHGRLAGRGSTTATRARHTETPVLPFGCKKKAVSTAESDKDLTAESDKDPTAESHVPNQINLWSLNGKVREPKRAALPGKAIPILDSIREEELPSIPPVYPAKPPQNHPPYGIYDAKQPSAGLATRPHPPASLVPTTDPPKPETPKAFRLPNGHVDWEAIYQNRQLSGHLHVCNPHHGKDSLDFTLGDLYHFLHRCFYGPPK